MYGDDDLTTLYLGSGGGSGGNALDLKTNPKGTTVIMLLLLYLFDSHIMYKHSELYAVL